MSATSRDCRSEPWASGVLCGRRAVARCRLRASKTGGDDALPGGGGQPGHSLWRRGRGGAGDRAAAVREEGAGVRTAVPGLRASSLRWMRGDAARCVQLQRSRLLPVVPRPEDGGDGGASHRRGLAGRGASSPVGTDGAVRMAQASRVRRGAVLGADAAVRQDGARLLPRARRRDGAGR